MPDPDESAQLVRSSDGGSELTVDFVVDLDGDGIDEVAASNQGYEDIDWSAWRFTAQGVESVSLGTHGF